MEPNKVAEVPVDFVLVPADIFWEMQRLLMNPPHVINLAGNLPNGKLDMEPGHMRIVEKKDVRE